MDLPEKHLKSTKGQILILFLLVLVVGIAIVLSVASRTITDIRTTTTSDESNRAYFAAEAGIEEALQQLQGGGAIPATGLDINFPNINTQAETKDITTTAGDVLIFIYPNDVEKDDVAQVMMLNNLSDPSSGWDGSELIFYWGNDSHLAPGAVRPAIEISAVYYDGGYNITKFAFDPSTGRLPVDNNFCLATLDTNQREDSISHAGETFQFKTEVNIENGDVNGASSCTTTTGSTMDLEGIGTASPVLLRIRTLYNSTPIGVEVKDPAHPLPSQGSVIESTGTTASGVTRKLQVTRLHPALPAIFDYVLFSGSGLSK